MILIFVQQSFHTYIGAYRTWLLHILVTDTSITVMYSSNFVVFGLHMYGSSYFFKKCFIILMTNKTTRTLIFTFENAGVQTILYLCFKPWSHWGPSSFSVFKSLYDRLGFPPSMRRNPDDTSVMHRYMIFSFMSVSETYTYPLDMPRLGYVSKDSKLDPLTNNKIPRVWWYSGAQPLPSSGFDFVLAWVFSGGEQISTGHPIKTLLCIQFITFFML